MTITAMLVTLSLVKEASADCLYRANGVQYEQGQLVCLSLPEGPRLARCEKVLNNSSWRFLKESCLQTTELTDQGRHLASLPVMPARHLGQRLQ